MGPLSGSLLLNPVAPDLVAYFEVVGFWEVALHCIASMKGREASFTPTRTESPKPSNAGIHSACLNSFRCVVDLPENLVPFRASLQKHASWPSQYLVG